MEELKSSGNYLTEAVLNKQLPIQIPMTYNKIRHLELLRPFLDFKNQGKNTYDLYLENQDEYMELQEYRCALYHHIFWKRKEQFVLLMDNFIQDSIDMEKFETAFSQL